MKEETVLDLLDWMKAESEKNAKKCIELIDNCKPCILLIDDPLSGSGVSEEEYKEQCLEHEEGHDAGELSRQDPDETVSILPCPKNCLKEVNPEKHPGIYFRQPFVYEERWYGCWLCQREIRHIGGKVDEQ